jgi:hypothetical protein
MQKWIGNRRSDQRWLRFRFAAANPKEPGSNDEKGDRQAGSRRQERLPVQSANGQA